MQSASEAGLWDYISGNYASGRKDPEWASYSGGADMIKNPEMPDTDVKVGGSLVEGAKKSGGNPYVAAGTAVLDYMQKKKAAEAADRKFGADQARATGQRYAQYQSSAISAAMQAMKDRARVGGAFFA